MPGPSPEDSRLLEPYDNAYEVSSVTHEQVGIDFEELDLETDGEAEGFVRKRLGLGFWVSTGWLAFITSLALLAPVLTPSIIQDPFTQNKDAARKVIKFSGPTAAHFLGTDNLGRDQLSRIIWGARVSLAVGFASILLGLLIGTAIGLLSGYLKGWIDSSLMILVDVILAFPPLLLAMAIVTFTDSKDIAHISLAIGIVAVPAIARLVRANTMSFREREFVLASRTLGASHLRVLVREILPNVVPPVLSFAVIGVAVAIAAESSLAFVGVGVPLPTATWGGMINEARQNMTEHPFQVFLPCLVLVLTIMALYFAGDRLRAFFDVKESAL